LALLGRLPSARLDGSSGRRPRNLHTNGSGAIVVLVPHRVKAMTAISVCPDFASPFCGATLLADADLA
jgi:hypothetical protein